MTDTVNTAPAPLLLDANATAPSTVTSGPATGSREGQADSESEEQPQ